MDFALNVSFFTKCKNFPPVYPFISSVKAQFSTILASITDLVCWSLYLALEEYTKLYSFGAIILFEG